MATTFYYKVFHKKVLDLKIIILYNKNSYMSK